MALLFRNRLYKILLQAYFINRRVFKSWTDIEYLILFI